MLLPQEVHQRGASPPPVFIVRHEGYGVGAWHHVLDQGDVGTGGIDCAAVVEEVADGAPGVEDDGGLAAEVEADDGGGVCLGPLGEG